MRTIASFFRWIVKLGLMFATAIVMVAVAAYLYLAPQLPPAETYKDVQLETPLRIYTADGLLIDEIGNRRNPLRFEEISPVMVNALIASEDARFYSHPGVDVRSLVRGFWGFVTGSDLGGGSTIAMQLTKLISFDNDNVYRRKLKEIPFALQIQRELTKEEVLTLYLNLIFFGQGAEGISAASFIYYGKPASELNLAESAMMVSLLPCPSVCNPLYNPERALARRNSRLDIMFKEGMATEAELEAAKNSPITAARHGRNREVPAPYVAEMVRQQLYQSYGEETYTQGFEVVTTIQSDKQLAANKALVDGLEIYYDKSHGYRGVNVNYPPDPLDPVRLWQEELTDVPVYGNQHPAIVVEINERDISALLKSGELVTIGWQGLNWARPFISQSAAGPRPQSARELFQLGDLIRLKQETQGWALGQIPDIEGALVSMSPSSGEIIALVGGYDFRRSQVNRVLTPRPPGSNFKPFLYGAALENGYTVASTINDAPITRGEYRPNNYENNFLGPITLRHALKDSRNVPAVRLYDQLGSHQVLPFAAKFGFQTRNFPRNDLTVALGSRDVQPLELVTGYSVIANGGYKVDPWFIQTIRDVNSNVVYQARPAIVCENCNTDGSYNESIDEFSIAPQIVDPRIAYILNSMLRSVVEEGSGARVQRDLKRGDLMGKTGTTNGPQELWFSGFNRDIATTVFVGFDQPKPLGEREQGATVAVPIWIDYMRQALAGTPENTMRRPEGLVDRLINNDTGEFAQPGDPNSRFEYFRAENAPLIESSTPRLPGVDPNNEEDESLSTEIIF